MMSLHVIPPDILKLFQNKTKYLKVGGKAIISCEKIRGYYGPIYHWLDSRGLMYKIMSRKPGQGYGKFIITRCELPSLSSMALVEETLMKAAIEGKDAILLEGYEPEERERILAWLRFRGLKAVEKAGVLSIIWGRPFHRNL